MIMHLFLPQTDIYLPKINEKKNAPTGLKLNIQPITVNETPALS